MLIFILILSIISAMIYKYGGKSRVNVREMTFVLASYKGQLIARKRESQNRIQVPGGGLNKNEAPENGALRELQEETGACATTAQQVRQPMKISKHLERDGQIYTHLMVYFVAPVNSKGKLYHIDSIGTPTSTEGDAWKDDLFMDFDDAIDYFTENIKLRPKDVQQLERALIVEMCKCYKKSIN